MSAVFAVLGLLFSLGIPLAIVATTIGLSLRLAQGTPPTGMTVVGPPGVAIALGAMGGAVPGVVMLVATAVGGGVDTEFVKFALLIGGSSMLSQAGATALFYAVGAGAAATVSRDLRARAPWLRPSAGVALLAVLGFAAIGFAVVASIRVLD
jgi:hypothetical protein